MAHFKTTFDYFDLLKTYVGFDFWTNFWVLFKPLLAAEL